MENIKMQGVKLSYLRSKLAFVNDTGELLDVSISTHKTKRSLEANAYCWHLINQIASALNESKERVYEGMLFDYGVTYEAIIKHGVNPKAFDYFKYKNTIKLNGKEADVYRVAVGSSKYNTKEMATFIDGIIQEAINLDIQVLNNDEIKNLKGNWGNEQ